jgi:Rhodopirellula transposase DDE domain
MHDATILDGLQRKYHALSAILDERARRQWAATEARELGWGGITALAAATGLARDTIRSGLRELDERAAHPDDVPEQRLRRPGAGRKPLTVVDPGLPHALDTLVDPVTRGDPESPLRWTCKSTYRLAEELTRQGHSVSPRTVAALLQADGYSLQANRKTREGRSHPDRNAPFEYLNHRVRLFQRQGQPVISVDTKKKELVGDFKNGGREWQPAGQPEEVRTHDFQDKELGKAIPYGVYDITSNEGWVSVGIDHDTAYFAVASIRRWWQEMGQGRFGRARRLLITADGGGSNGSRSRLWKVALQGLADELGLALSVCHFPPGTSKWNKVEHRLFSYITQNWRGQPLVSRQAIVSLIAATTTKSGLTVRSALDTNTYETGIKVSDEELAHVKLKPDDFHGNWNYQIAPRKHS